MNNINMKNFLPKVGVRGAVFLEKNSIKGDLTSYVYDPSTHFN